MVTLKRKGKVPPKLKAYNKEYHQKIDNINDISKQNEIMKQFWGKNIQVRKELVNEFEKINDSRCSFCTQIIPDFMKSMEVEHIELKSHEPKKALEWSNMLCSCSTCNRKRSIKKYESIKYIDPTIERRVERYFEFLVTGEIQHKKGLSTSDKAKADYMIKLYDLNDKDRIYKRMEFIQDIQDKDTFRFFKKHSKYARFLDVWKYYEGRKPYGK